LILQRIEGFFTTGGSLTAWIGTPSRYTVSLFKSSGGGRHAPRRRSFMAQPFRHPKTGIFQLRRKVPEELRAALGREFKRSLRTRDPHEAKARFAAAWAESEQAFASARAQLGGAESLTQRDAQQLAARWFRVEQEKLERTGAFTDMLAQVASVAYELGDRHEEHPVFTTLREGAVQDPEIDWGEDVVRPVIERTLRRHNLPMPSRDSRAYSWLYAAFDEHVEKLSQWALKRHECEMAPLGIGVVPIEPIDIERRQEPAKQGEAHTLRELFDAYSEEKTLNDGDNRATRRTIKAYRAIVEGFVELHGNMGVRDISRDVIAQYRASLAKLPAKGEGIRGLKAQQLIDKAEKQGLLRLSQPTIRNRLRAVSAVLSCGVRRGWLDENPVIAGGAGRAAAKAANKRQAGAGRRKHYTRNELDAIFTSPVYSDAGWAPPRADFGKAWYWLPLLLYYTGARREELAQLAVTDVKHDEDAGWHLNILATEDDEDGKRGVKNLGSRRLIPLHPDLIDRGLIDYLESVPADGQLFPKLRPDPKGYYGANFGKRWAAYLRDTVKLASPASPAHGFRHTFKTLCREVGIPEDVHDAITGHAGNGGVARDYGTMPLARMAAQMARYPTLSARPIKTQEVVDPLAFTPSERAELAARLRSERRPV
jgi:integrase